MRDPSLEELDYQPRTDHVTHRLLRILIVLMLINTLLLGTFVAGPLASQLLQQKWQEFQARQTERQEQARRAAALREREIALLQYFQHAVAAAAPVEGIAYTEDPQEAMALLADAQFGVVGRPQAAHSPTAPPGSAGAVWQMPAVRRPADPWEKYLSLHPSIHAMGHVLLERVGDHLLWIGIDADQRGGSWRGGNVHDGPRHRMVHTSRTLSIVSYSLDADDQPQSSERIELVFQQGDDQAMRIALDGTILAPGQQFRIFCGRAEGPGHYIVEYEMDGRRGVIDVLRGDDGVLSVRPREGRILSRDDRSLHWDPAAEPAD